jgi:uncharacterized protein DUF4406
MTKVYIAGPIHGTGGGDDQNIEAFKKAATPFLGHENVEIIYPQLVSREHDGACIGHRQTDRNNDPHLYGCYLMTAMRAMADCDVVQLVPGWENSLGAQAEVALAKALHIHVIYPEPESSL